MFISREDMLERFSEDDVRVAEVEGLRLLKLVAVSDCDAHARSFDVHILFRFDRLPKVIRKVCDFNGGDEDWAVLSLNEACDQSDPLFISDIPGLWDRDTGDPDVYVFGSICVFVLSHS